MTRRASPIDRREAFTILEVAMALGLATLILLAIGMVFSAISASATESDRRLLAQTESDRAILALIQDLQTTNPVERDGLGRPYIEVLDIAPGLSNGIRFRRVEGYEADAATDIVEPVYGDPIQYSVDPEENLVRAQGTERRIVANRVSSLSFSLSATGTIEFRIETYSGDAAQRILVENTISVTPRNGFGR